MQAHAHTHTSIKVKIYGNFPNFYAYKCILYFTNDRRCAEEEVVCAWFHLRCWHVDIKIQVFLYSGDIWTSFRVHIRPFQITSLQSAALCFRGKITLLFFVPTTFCCEYIYTHYFQMFKLGLHCPTLDCQSLFKLLAIIWVFILFVQGLKYLVENCWYICFCNFFF